MSSIEKDIKNIKQYINLVLDEGYCDCNELNMISTGRYCDGSKNVAYSMQNILSERESDKKRIKELEEENRIFALAGSRVALKLHIEENYIPKQKVKDLKESIILEPTIVGGRRNAKTLEYGIKLGKIKACEELLEDK